MNPTFIITFASFKYQKRMSTIILELSLPVTIRRLR